MKLFVVESPNKCKTIAKYLGADYEVLATAGHVRDLPLGELGVDLGTFTPSYVMLDAKKANVERILAAAKKASEIILATDPDREGEAIAWHVAQLLKAKSVKRALYTEITAEALSAAIATASTVNQPRVDAQQARRVLDRLVGFQVSPLLAAFGRNNSAGRVQSATLHLVVTREQEREAFRPLGYWTVTATYPPGFRARHVDLFEGELVDARLPTEAAAQEVARRAQGPHVVTKRETRPVSRKPRPPFITSTLQQLASTRLKIDPKETMQLAQALFEKGAITYHRTDSPAVSDDGAAMARDFLAKDYPEAIPAKPPQYAAKADAQGAHEAIRPTSLDDSALPDLTEQERRLYQLIRSRFIASQCKPAELEETTLLLDAGGTTWRARGSVIVFESFLRYLDTDEDNAGVATEEEGSPSRLPPLEVGASFESVQLSVERKQTQPPPRYTRAALVKEMERQGIGRPATFAATLDVLEVREYVAEEKRQLYPTPKGRLIDEALAAAFPALVETTYTAEMESVLDAVEAGKRPWKEALRSWYASFAPLLQAAPPKLAAVAAAHPEIAALVPAAPELTDRTCPLCSKPLHLRRSKEDTPFLSCSGFPTCTFSGPPDFQLHEAPCPQCGKPMLRLAGKFGPYARCANRSCTGKLDLTVAGAEPCPVCAGPTRDRGEFLGCARYPECRGRWDKKALAAAKALNRLCPKCGKGRLLVPKENARGAFLGCSGYPECDFLEHQAPSAAPKGKSDSKAPARSKARRKD